MSTNKKRNMPKKKTQLNKHKEAENITNGRHTTII